MSGGRVRCASSSHILIYLFGKLFSLWVGLCASEQDYYARTQGILSVRDFWGYIYFGLVNISV